MIKKIFIVFILLLVGVSSFAVSYKHYGHNVKCAKCVEQHEKNSGYHIHIAWRTCNYKNIDGVTCAEYRCDGGHSYFAEIAG